MMKLPKLFFLILVLITLVSCGSNDDSENNSSDLFRNVGDTPEEIMENAPYLTEDNYELIAEQFKSDKGFDSIFLGYRFGMTKKEVEEHTQELIRAGKLVDSSPVIHQFNELEGSPRASLNFKYNKNELYLLQFEIPAANEQDQYLKTLLKDCIRKYIIDVEDGKKAVYLKEKVAESGDSAGEVHGIYRGHDLIAFLTTGNTITIGYKGMDKRPEYEMTE